MRRAGQGCAWLTRFAQAKDTALGNIEMLKQERDIFVAFTQLFVRHDSESSSRGSSPRREYSFPAQNSPRTR